MDVFVARQPIFDQNQNVFGYEILFRSGRDNYFDNSDGDKASLSVINQCLLVFGLNRMTGGKIAFINFTRNLLVTEIASLLPQEFTALEILEDVEPDEELIQACERLKEAGYTLVLDDFEETGMEDLTELADIIKVDFMNTSLIKRREILQKYSRKGIRMLAEKVETREEFEQAKAMGYEYFQGYFFSKPMIMSGKDLPGFKANYLQIMKEINNPELDYQQIEAIIMREQSLCYKFLVFVNSVAFGWQQRIESIKQALVLMGTDNLKKWVSLVVLTNMAEDKPRELMMHSITRAKFLELLAGHAGLRDREQDLFLMGMFSMIDAIVDRPLGEILGDMHIAEDVKQTLLGKESGLTPLYNAGLAYERGDWSGFLAASAGLDIDVNAVPELYLEAVDWPSKVLGG